MCDWENEVLWPPAQEDSSNGSQYRISSKAKVFLVTLFVKRIPALWKAAGMDNLI